MPDEIQRREDGSIEYQVGGAITRGVVPPGGPTKPLEDRSDDGYPDIILDQRRGYAGLETNDVEEVFVHWENFLARQRPQRAPWVSSHAVVPYVNQSRWVADCDCGGGMLCWDQNPYACCLDCGGFYAVNWHLPDERSAVVRTLAIREPNHRNWDPRRTDKQGERIETIEFLKRENVLMHGREE